MNKSPEAFRTISEVADALDVPPHVLRFWETRFTQVKPVKRGGGRRYYRPEDVRLLRGIRGLLYDDGMTIKGVQKILRERGIRHVIGLGVEPDADLEPEAPPAPAPKAKPSAPRAPTPRAAAPRAAAPRAAAPVAAAPRAAAARPAPQADLFEPAGGGTATATVEAPATRAEAATAAAKPLDKRALKTLLSELKALRTVMTDDSQR